MKKSVSKSVRDKLEKLVKSVAEYIISCQTKEGAICDFPLNKNKKRYYLVMIYNFAPIGLLKLAEYSKEQKYLAAVKKWILFWAEKQNKQPDRFGLVGTFYDYIYDIKTEKYFYRIFGAENLANQGGPGYDSTDAYPSMFLYVIHQYFELTKDEKLLYDLKPTIILAANSILYTKSKNNLTFAHPNWPYIYMMDETETYAGLVSAANLFEILKEKELKKYYMDEAMDLKNGILNLWDELNGYFIWGLKRENEKNYIDYEYKQLTTNWEIWFPDVCENLWPILWKIVPPESSIAKTVWKKLKTKYPDFYKNVSKYSCLPQIAYVAVMMKDYEVAQSIVLNIDENFELVINQQHFGISHELGLLPAVIVELLSSN